jgi:hypothetical protein
VNVSSDGERPYATYAFLLLDAVPLLVSTRGRNNYQL